MYEGEEQIPEDSPFGQMTAQIAHLYFSQSINFLDVIDLGNAVNQLRANESITRKQYDTLFDLLALFVTQKIVARRHAHYWEELSDQLENLRIKEKKPWLLSILPDSHQGMSPIVQAFGYSDDLFFATLQRAERLSGAFALPLISLLRHDLKKGRSNGGAGITIALNQYLAHAAGIRAFAASGQTNTADVVHWLGSALVLSQPAQAIRAASTVYMCLPPDRRFEMNECVRGTDWYRRLDELSLQLACGGKFVNIPDALERFYIPKAAPVEPLFSQGTVIMSWDSLRYSDRLLATQLLSGIRHINARTTASRLSAAVSRHKVASN